VRRAKARSRARELRLNEIKIHVPSGRLRFSNDESGSSDEIADAKLAQNTIRACSKRYAMTFPDEPDKGNGDGILASRIHAVEGVRLNSDAKGVVAAAAAHGAPVFGLWLDSRGGLPACVRSTFLRTPSGPCSIDDGRGNVVPPGAIRYLCGFDRRPNLRTDLPA
jgi:hypothetical protein